MNSLDERNEIYRIPIRPRYKKRRKQKKPFGFFKFLFLSLFFAVSIYFLLNYHLKREYIPENITTNATKELNFHFSPKRQNILLMGIDVASNSDNPFKGNRSDTMLLISIAPYGKNVNVISIPRDSKVYIAGKNKPDKINHAFAFGGARLAVRTVEETFGIKINHYFAISNAGVIKMIDVLGGLPIYIEKNMQYDDYAGKLHINLKQGEHILSGKETEGYLRFRHDSYGDIGRIRRQQWFFNALIARLKDPTVIVKLPELLKTLPEYIQTDLSGYDIAKFLGLAKGIDSSLIQIATIPGSPSTKGLISYWIIDPAKTQDLINKMVYRNKSEIDLRELSVGILYSSSNEENAKAVQAELEAKGISVKIQPAKATSKDYIAIHNLDIAGDTISELKKTIPIIKDSHTIYDPIGINRTGKDMTIVISGL